MRPPTPSPALLQELINIPFEPKIEIFGWFGVGSVYRRAYNNKSTSVLAPQVGCAAALYGPRTTLMLGLQDGVHEFTLTCGHWVLTREALKVAPKAKVFAPGNLRATQELPWYRTLMDRWMERRLTLRYTGGMVPDVLQFLIKGVGCASRGCRWGGMPCQA